MKNKIVILGSGTCNIEKDRANSSILISINATNIIYDFGYRVFFRLKQLKLKQDNISHVIISHFHPDHFCDLIPFIHSGFYSSIDRRREILNIYTNSDGERFLKIIKELLLNPIEFDRLINLNVLSENHQFIIDSVNFSFQYSTHFKNISLKFYLNDKLITISGDIDFENDNLAFFEGSDFCFLNSGDLTLEKILDFKNKYKIKNLIILHSYNMNKISKEGIIIAEDLMEFYF